MKLCEPLRILRVTFYCMLTNTGKVCNHLFLVAFHTFEDSVGDPLVLESPRHRKSVGGGVAGGGVVY